MGGGGGVAPAPGAPQLTPQTLPLARGDVEGRAGDRAIAWSARTVAPTLESGRALPLGRWVVVRCHLLIGPFKFKFDHLNTNLTV
jgi:hypothetical protein